VPSALYLHARLSYDTGVLKRMETKPAKQQLGVLLEGLADSAKALARAHNADNGSIDAELCQVELALSGVFRAVGLCRRRRPR
jgi:hypothetical protein